jgi:hypothetical protein
MPENLLTPDPRPAAPPAAAPASATPAAAAAVPPAAKPAAAAATTPGGIAVPAKFVDPETGEIRLDALVKSYLELEKKLSGMVALPTADRPLPDEDRGRLMAALGVPETAEGYEVALDHGLFEADQEINARLHAAGFTPQQVQLVYDLAAERLVPLVEEMGAEFEAEREIERLVRHFGGEEKWREVSRQMLAWAKKHLPAEAIEGLSASFDGVMALYRMMTAEGEPAALVGEGEGPDGGETELHALMRDPKYWRDKDPSTIARVTDGFRRLYPERE